MKVFVKGDLLDYTNIVVSAQSGDHQAFAKLYERFQPMVLSIAFQRLRSQHNAEDLTQDVFIRVKEKLYQLKKPEAFPAWIRMTTIRMAINILIRKKNSSEKPIQNEVLETCIQVEGGEGLKSLLNSEELEELRNSIERLKPLDSMTLKARYLCGLSLNEMSNKHEAPLGTIKRRLHTARKRLAKEMKSYNDV